MQKSVGEYVSNYKGLKLELVSPSPTIPHDPPYKEMLENDGWSSGLKLFDIGRARK